MRFQSDCLFKTVHDVTLENFPRLLLIFILLFVHSIMNCKVSEHYETRYINNMYYYY